MSKDTLCPCGSKAAYDECCGLYIDQGKSAPTPEALMRSRYTAYTMANILHVDKTQRDEDDDPFDPAKAEDWAKHSKWLGLEVKRSWFDESNPNVGYVEFVARYEYKNKPERLHEISLFEKVDGEWLYVDGEMQEPPKPKQHVNPNKVGRNEPCPCGSGKKYKQCCLRKA